MSDDDTQAGSATPGSDQAPAGGEAGADSGAATPAGE
jgi:hypothetical protein